MKRRNVKNRTGGEILVETIVSFAVLLLILSTVTTLVMAAIRLNGRAGERNLALENASAEVRLLQGTDVGTGNLTITVTDPATNPSIAPVPISIRDAGSTEPGGVTLRYFTVTTP